MRLSVPAYGLIAALICAGCNPAEPGAAALTGVQKDTTVRYARRFAMAKMGTRKIIYLFGNRHNFDTTAVFVLCRSGDTALPAQATAIEIPCKKIASLSCIYTSMLCELGAGNAVAAIDNIDYVSEPAIIEKHKKGALMELARTPDIDIERTVRLGPDIIFTFGMGDGRDVDPKLQQTGIPFAISVDHLEETPLARAEWIRFFAAFVDKDARADSIFRKVESNYKQLKALAASAAEKPTVFSEIKFGDTWYMPGGKSYMATLLKDAAADYLWKNDTSAGSLPLSFEQVFARARNGDYWLNLSTLKTKKELLASDARYAEFKAAKTGNLYNNNRVTNQNGYTVYWETGMSHPDRILKDLVTIFHPGLSENRGSELYYYRKLE
jgi:iron complex transport system substrate-binding protein